MTALFKTIPANVLTLLGWVDAHPVATLIAGVVVGVTATAASLKLGAWRRNGA
jgi:hypothetical protein